MIKKQETKNATFLIPQERVENKIFLIRGAKVMLDTDLALLYQVKTMVLNQAVKRNIKRFPDDFMFRLTLAEKEEVITNCDHLRHLKYSAHKPYAFTEQGVAMLSSVLKSERAIQVNIQIMRTFTKIKEMIISNKELRLKMEEMEKRYDGKFTVVFRAIAKLIGNPEKISKKRIGFKVE
jgi:hypothetical protein